MIEGTKHGLRLDEIRNWLGKVVYAKRSTHPNHWHYQVFKPNNFLPNADNLAL